MMWRKSSNSLAGCRAVAPRSATRASAVANVNSHMNWLLIRHLAVVCLFTSVHAPAQITNLLLKEVVSRELSVSVGGVSFPEYKEIVSRETSVFIGSEPEPPYKQVASRELTVVVTTPSAPARLIQLRVNATTLGDQATLWWSNYNQWAESDVAGYAIYLSDRPFTNVSGMKPYTNTLAETFTITLSGLATWQDHFFAVVPVDVAGNVDPVVNYAAAYIIAREVVSRETSVFIGSEPEPPYKQLASRELTVVVTTPEAPVPITQLSVAATTLGDAATLSWAAYNQWAESDVAGYAIYLSDRPFTNVSGMKPYTNTPGETFTITLSGLAAWQDHFFAVVPVDAAGNSDPVVNWAAAYIIAREVVSRETTVFIGAEPDPPYNQLTSRELSFVVSTPAVPDPVTVLNSGFAAVQSRNFFSAIDLDWSTYNAWAQNDIVRYRIYLGLTFFDDVSDMEPYLYLPAETSQWTIAALYPLNVYYVAVVAEDSLEHINPIVRSVSAQASIDSVREVQNLQAVSGSNSLTFTWLPPQGADPHTNNLLAGYRVYLAGAATPVTLDRMALSYTATNLLPAHGYPFRITTVDNTNRESDGASLLAATLLQPPVNLLAQGLDSRVRLTWDHVPQFDLLKQYAVYIAQTNFTTTAGMAPVVKTRANRVDIPGLVNGQIYYMAVTVVDLSDGVSALSQTIAAIPNIVVGDFADLMITNVTGSVLAPPGGMARFGWTVDNIGAGATSRQDGTSVSSWSDRVILSRDDVLGNADDVVVADISHNSALEFGGAYSTNVIIPVPWIAPGTYHVFVEADAMGAVYQYLDAGTNAGLAPGILAIHLALPPGDQWANVLETLLVTNAPLVTNLPSGPLSFDLVQSPEAMSIDAVTGIIRWTPGLAQASSTNLVTVRIAANGTPPLTETNTFRVMVNSTPRPTIRLVKWESGMPVLRIDGPTGPDYVIELSDNLHDWQVAARISSPATLPFVWTDTSAPGVPARFYRARLAP